MKYRNIREEELKNKVGTEFFKDYDTTEIVGNIDFTVLPRQETIFGRTALLWAEAKTGNYDTTTMFVQLILTIGKARTFDKTFPPAFLGAFDGQKIAFVPYINIQDIFYLNDFNWNVTPSNHTTKEFQLIKERIDQTLKKTSYVYDYLTDEKELRFFIKNNIANASEVRKIKIDKNNFIPIYLRWLEIVKPTIDVDWEELKKNNILDSDFYLADIFVDDKDTQKLDDDTSIRDSLFVIYQNQGYKISKDNLRQMFDATISIRNKDTYQQFWKRYKRPPINEFQEYIIERRDLLVPQDIRERKGAFFTPRKWVELSQKYLTDYLGENWQDDYYIWDCAAGTGNLLAGFTNKFNIWASTLDMADVNVMHERIDHGANLLKSHVFQFDFLNDDFSKLPQGLQDIINDEEKRKKLIIYINPPYAEATTAKTVTGTGTNKAGVANKHKTLEKYKTFMGRASNEIFAHFLARIYNEIPNSKIAEFSTLKILQSSNFKDFRKNFRAKLEKIFAVPADTFDNVKGKFPIGFLIWDTSIKEIFEESTLDLYTRSGDFLYSKGIYSNDDTRSINKWIKIFLDESNNTIIGYLPSPAPDFQNQKFLFLTIEKGTRHVYYLPITKNNIFKISIYYTVRHAIPATWLNDRDQFLYPNGGWQSDQEFQNDCLTYTLFSNNISSKEGTNHWIPFTEQEVNAQDKFHSRFMTDFIQGKCKSTINIEPNPLFTTEGNSWHIPTKPLQFSEEAQSVFQAGKALWQYYHAQNNAQPNASLYDIREHFQGRNEKGRMNAHSTDQHYTQLITQLRDTLKDLAQKITPKIYEYGFLKE
ncbi:hypothetical protein [Riemerella columbina]|uniref:hypothetical protein n=1 Tax=Riemerella columbina TaxID=103810 RepID=UPI00035FC5DB|nr:hypothetical protein [Riemerella columbina]